jgi:hypothetical protein
MENPMQWSKKAELAITMRRMGGEKQAKSPAFWPGRPNLYQTENPIVADGEILGLAFEAMKSISDGQDELLGALTSNHEFTDRDLKDAQQYLRVAIAKIETVRERIIGAGEVLEAIEREAEQ